jgi:hypothetical protein
MKITWRTAGGGSYSATLADDANRLFVSTFLPRMSDSVQVDGLFRSANAQVKARGNRRWSLAIVVEKEHASVDAATVFLASDPAAVSSLILVDLKVEGGASPIYYANCKLTGYTPVQTGKSTSVRYEFVFQLASTAAV